MREPLPHPARTSELLKNAAVYLIVAVAALCISANVAAGPPPQDQRHKTDAAKPQVREEPVPPEAEVPYERQILRLAEILGALTYLRDICGANDGPVWRDKMQALLEAEAKTPPRRERLAGAYNQGLRGYQLTYRACTPNAELIISRFLDEGGKIARGVANRYGSS
jgi:uncharacterized protein (TIGR02301 family)